MHIFFMWNRYIRKKLKREQLWYKEKKQDKRQSYGQDEWTKMHVI